MSLKSPSLEAERSALRRLSCIEGIGEVQVDGVGMIGSWSVFGWCFAG